MDITSLGSIRLSECAPRMSVKICGSCNIGGDTAMYLRKAGDTQEQEFAKYPPSDIQGSSYIFQFDSLLFDKPSGHYIGRLIIDGSSYGECKLQVTSSKKIAQLSNVKESGGSDCSC